MIWKEILTSTVVVAAVVIAVYLLSLLGSNVRGGDGVFGSFEIRTIVTLSVVGGSAFITGFGSRDVIGRIMGARQRNRLKQAQQQVKH